MSGERSRARRPWQARLAALALERPWTVLLLAALVTVPAIASLRQLGLDTDLLRLLPGHTRAATATRQLEGVAGASSSFGIVLEVGSGEQDRLAAALEAVAARVAVLPGVATVEYRNPVEFIERYRYLLVPSYYLEVAEEQVLRWQEEVNPLLVGLDDEAASGESFGEREDRKEIEALLERYGSMPAYHMSDDRTLGGILVRPGQQVTSLGRTRALLARLEAVVEELAAERGVRAGVAGSMRNKVDEYDLIVEDLRNAGVVSGVLILGVLFATFGVRVQAVLPLVPLLAGLCWSFALAPYTVGDLNMISAFMLLVAFGMGIDFSVHLLQRFRRELVARPLARALHETWSTTGRAVWVSGASTALALAIPAMSDFRGFSEFAMVGAFALVAVLAANFLLFPAVVVLGVRHGLIVPAGHGAPRAWVPGRSFAVIVLAIAAGSAVFALAQLRFDFDFSNLRPDAEDRPGQEVRERLQRVYTTTRSPGALYVAADERVLGVAATVLRQARARPDSTIGRIASLRDLVPEAEEMARRRELLDRIREDLEGAWVRRVEDPVRQRWIRDLQAWSPVDQAPTASELPASLRDPFMAADGSGRYLLAVYPAVERKVGQNAMAFTRELYGLQMPDGVEGPVGETPVFAEILWLTLSEGPWLIGATLLGVALLLLVYQRSVGQTLWILMPLATGLSLTLGLMAAAGIRLNFFSMVVFPALIGLGVDDGVHFYRRWRELGGDTRAASRELTAPLTVTSLTTIMGYSGMLFARHPGLSSIGTAACLGLALVWFTSLFLLPSLLDWLHPGLERGGTA